MIFRHADANVMAQILPVMEAAQHARLLGPARVILFLPDVEWDCGIRRVDRPDSGPGARPGPLSISARQIEAMCEVRLRGFDARMAEVVRLKHFGGDHPDGNRLVDTVSRHRRQAEAFGVENEQHFIDFVEVMLIAGAHVIDEDDFRAIMHRPGWLMEEKCRRLRRHYLGN